MTMLVMMMMMMMAALAVIATILNGLSVLPAPRLKVRCPNHMKRRLKIVGTKNNEDFVEAIRHL